MLATNDIAIAINMIACDDTKAQLLSRCVWCLEEQDQQQTWATYSVRGGDCGTCAESGRDVLLVLAPISVSK